MKQNDNQSFVLVDEKILSNISYNDVLENKKDISGIQKKTLHCCATKS